MNNLFRNVQSAEREAGIDLFRKFFIKNENPNDLTFANPKMWIGNVSSGEDYFLLAAGTDSDNQSVSDDYTEWYGSGYLNENIGPTESSFDVLCKQGMGIPSDSLLIISDGSQQAEVLMVGAASWNGPIATVTISGEVGLTFLEDVTVVSPVLELDDLAPASANWAETSVSGTYDDTTYPLTLYNIGAITESWTLTFTSSTAFGVTGAVTGSVGTGSILTNFAPVNGAGYYFLIDKDGWGGSWLSGDTITFTTVHAAKSVWVKESVPAGAASQANNTMTIKLQGESA